MTKTNKIFTYTKWCEENYNLGDDELSSRIRDLLKQNDEDLANGKQGEYCRGKASDIQKARIQGCRTLREFRFFEMNPKRINFLLT